MGNNTNLLLIWWHQLITSEITIKWVEFVQGRETSRLLRIEYGEGFLDAIVKVQVQNGWGPHLLDPMIIFRQEEVSHLSWNYASAEYARLFSFFALCCVRIVLFYSLLKLYFKLYQDISKYKSFSMLPRDISQQIFNELVMSHYLTAASLEAFRDCALQVISQCISNRNTFIWLIMSQFSVFHTGLN